MNGGMLQLDGVTRLRLLGSSAEATLSDPQFEQQSTTITNAMGADGYSWSQARPITVDAFGKLISIAQISGSGNHNFVYCNNPDETVPIWTDNTGLSDESALTRGVLALDATNDVIHVLWNCTDVNDGMLYRRYTITRGVNDSISSISRDTGVNLQLDFQDTGVMGYQHPILLHFNDGGSDGTYGKLVAIWSARNTVGTGNEIRASMCVLGATADRGKTAGNWAAPVAADTTGIGNAPAVAYSIIATNTGSTIMYPSAGRKTAGTHANDIYCFYADGGSTNIFQWRRMRWNSGANDWSTGLISPASVSAIIRAGTDTGYSLKYELGSKPCEDTSNDRMYFGFANWKDNSAGDTWSFCYVDSADALSSIVDVYSAGGAHSYAPCGDIEFDNTTHRLAVSYIKTSTQFGYVQLYNGTTQTQGETAMFAAAPVDIPLLGARIGTGVAPVLFRDTNSPHTGWYGSMLWTGGSRTTSSGGATSPDDITGLLFWFKADAITGISNGNPVTTWPDSSGNGITATPNGSGCTYRTSVINGLPIVEFSGDNLSFAETQLGTTHTIFIVFRPILNFNDGVLLGGNGPNGRYAPYLDLTDIYYRTNPSNPLVSVAHGGLTTNVGYLLEIRRNGTSVSFYKNGVQLSTTQTLSVNEALPVLYLTSIDAVFQANHSQIAEMFVFDTALSTTDRELMEAYVSDRYAIF